MLLFQSDERAECRTTKIVGLLYQGTSPFQTAKGETAESTMGEKKACLDPEMKRNDGRGERSDIGDREKTEEDQSKQETDKTYGVGNKARQRDKNGGPKASNRGG